MAAKKTSNGKAAPATTKAPDKTNGKSPKHTTKPKPGTARYDYTSPFRIGDASSVKRGFIKEMVDWASAQDRFTRDEAVEKFKDQFSESKCKQWFSYCAANGVFVPAGQK